MNSRRIKGFYPHSAPQGYLNDRLNKTIIKDPDRFDLIRRAWKLMLSGEHTIAEIERLLNEKWGYRTRKCHKNGGKPYPKSGVYRMFTQIFYTGHFYVDGELIKGQHEPMITLAEFDRVQSLLGNTGRPRPFRHSFPYTGAMRCGECGCMITASSKTKYIKSSGETKVYTYYHCTKKKRDVVCTSKHCLREEALEKEIERILAGISIPTPFKDWCLEKLEMTIEEEAKAEKALEASRKSALDQASRQQERLTDMYLDGLIDANEYQEKKAELKKKLLKLEESQSIPGQTKSWNGQLQKVFEFAYGAQKLFKNGSTETKKKIFHTLGSNFEIKNGELA